MAIWKNEFTLEALNSMGQKSLPHYLGMEFIEFGDDYLKATMPVNEKTKQPFGLLHGGASIALAETVGSVASHLCIDFSTQSAVGLEINGNHLKAVKSGKVTATVRPIKIGKSIHVWQINIENDAAELINTTRFTTMILDKKS